jgi:hypothetical protein
MRQEKWFYYNEIAEFDRLYEDWQKENPRAKEVEQRHEAAENPNPINGINKGIVTYEEV